MSSQYPNPPLLDDVGGVVRGVQIYDGTMSKLMYSFCEGFGDIDGDGLPEIGLANSNSIYLIRGSALISAEDFIDLSGVDREIGISIKITETPHGAGDVNADGLDDLIFGIPFDNSDAGSARVLCSPIFEHIAPDGLLTCPLGIAGIIAFGCEGGPIGLGVTLAGIGWAEISNSQCKQEALQILMDCLGDALTRWYAPGKWCSCHK